MKAKLLALLVGSLTALACHAATGVVWSGLSPHTDGADLELNNQVARAQGFTFTGPRDLWVSRVSLFLRGQSSGTVRLEAYDSGLLSTEPILPQFFITALGTAAVGASDGGVYHFAPEAPIHLTPGSTVWFAASMASGTVWMPTAASYTTASFQGATFLPTKRVIATDGPTWAADPSAIPYALEVELSDVAVPEPGTSWLLGAAGAAACLFKFKRSRN